MASVGDQPASFRNLHGQVQRSVDGRRRSEAEETGTKFCEVSTRTGVVLRDSGSGKSLDLYRGATEAIGLIVALEKAEFAHIYWKLLEGWTSVNDNVESWERS